MSEVARDPFPVRRPAGLAAFRPPIVPPSVPTAPRPQVAFADLVRMLAESVSDAQRALDASSAATLVDLATTTVPVVPGVTERVASDGTVTYEHDEAREVSLLDIGMQPTFYQFSSAVVEVSMDLHVVESEESTSEGEIRRYGLFAGTEEVTNDRRFDRDLRATSKLTATLVPVPAPALITPSRRTVAEDPGDTP